MATKGDICVTKHISNEIVSLPKLDTKLRTLTGLLCDNIYDHLIFNVQENSSGQQYRHKLQAFLSTKQDEFYKIYTVCTGLRAQCNATGVTQNSRSRHSSSGAMGLEFSVSGTVCNGIESPAPNVNSTTTGIARPDSVSGTAGAKNSVN